VRIIFCDEEKRHRSHLESVGNVNAVHGRNRDQDKRRNQESKPDVVVSVVKRELEEHRKGLEPL
jgi:hypothetical protein